MHTHGPIITFLFESKYFIYNHIQLVLMPKTKKEMKKVRQLRKHNMSKDC